MPWKPGAGRHLRWKEQPPVEEEQKCIHRMERREQSSGVTWREGGGESQDDGGGFSGMVLPRCLSVKGSSELGLPREAFVLCEHERSEHTEG